jgi:excisionase family DNA binding protein
VEEIEYEDWYPDVPPVMTVQHLADLLHTNEQIIRAWVREGIIPAHRRPGGRKFTFLRHEIFDWLISNRYKPRRTARS